MNLINNIDIDGFNLSNAYVNWRIPIVTYTYTHEQALKDDLITIADDIEKLYATTKPGSINNGDGGTSTKSLLTHNFMHYNILDRTEKVSIRSFKKFIGQCYKHYIYEIAESKDEDMSDIYAQCWANKLECYDYLSDHSHMPLDDGVSCTSLTGHYHIHGGNIPTYTTYSSPTYINDRYDDSISITNHAGSLTLFPMFVRHKTSANRNNEPRYSLGFDIKRAAHITTNVTEGEHRICNVKLFEENEV